MTPTIGVLALQGDVQEHVAALDAVGARPRTVRRASELAGLDGLILPGGESTTIDKLVRVFDLDGPLREAIDAGLPVYGSCAGMILLADRILGGTSDQRTLGGLDVTVRRNAFGRQVDSFETDLDVELDDLPGPPLHAVFIRAPWVEDAGPGVRVLARVPMPRKGEALSGIPPGAAGRIVAIRQGKLLATSFHPEITGDTRVHHLFVRIVKE